MMQKILISLAVALLVTFGGCATGLKLQSRQQITQNLEKHYSNPETRKIEAPLGEIVAQQASLGGALMYIALGIAGDEPAQKLFRPRLLEIAQDADYVEYLILQARVALHEARYDDVKDIVAQAEALQKSIIERLKAVLPEIKKYWDDKKMTKEGI